MSYRPILFSSLAVLGTGLAFAASDVLSLGEIETRLNAQGIQIREIEIKDLVVEVEGRDAQGRKVELLLDRRTGDILSRKADD